MTIPFGTVQYLSGAPGATTKRTPAQRSSYIIDVKDFGAVGDGSTPDTTAVQNALNAAANFGSVPTNGTILFFPPGLYNVSQLTNTVASSLSIVGSGKYSTAILGNSSGYTLDFPAQSGGGGPNAILHIENIAISNSSTTAGSGALRVGYIEREFSCNDCQITGFIGANVASNLISGGSFGSSFRDCVFACSAPVGAADFFTFNNGTGTSGPPLIGYAGMAPGSVGVYLGQGIVENCRITLFDRAICMSGTCPCVVSTSSERCNNAIYVGLRDDGAWPCNGGLVIGHQAERCNVGYEFDNGLGMFFGGNILQGPGGTPDYATIANMLWSSGSGGVVTVTTANAHHLTVGTSPWIELNAVQAQFIPAGANAGQVHTINVTDATHFTYALTVNPGVTFTSGQWNIPPQVGLRVKSSQETTFSSIIMNQFRPVIASVDLDNGGTTGTQNNNVFLACKFPSGLLLPTYGPNKTGWQYVGCGNAFGNPGINATFADLPGQSGVQQPGPTEGQEYSIINQLGSGGSGGTLNTFPPTFGQAGAAGSGSTAFHAKLRYNGTAWTVVGV